jgi:hypothetical protein
MKRLSVLILILLMSSVACRSTTTTTTPGQVASPATLAPTLSPPTATPEIPSSDLWYLTRGDVKSDQAWGIDTDSAGNIYAAAYMQQPPTKPFFDMVIYKFSPDGEEIWQTQWGGDLEEKAFIVVVDEPVVYVGGLVHTKMAIAEADMALLALDMATGEVLWDFSWGQGYGYDELDGLVVDGDFIYISGWTASEKTSEDMAVLKLDKKGKLIWQTTWGGDGFDEGDGQIVVDENAIYVCGRADAAGILSGGESVLVKFSKVDGSTIDSVTWGGSNFDDGFGMTSDGTFLYVTGLTLSKGKGGQIFLLKYDKDLNLVWERIWGGAGGETARSVEVDSDGNILIAGLTSSYGAGGDDVVLLKYSPEGELIWYQTWGGALNEAIHGMAIDGDFVYLAGNTDSFSKGMNDALIIKANRLTGEFPGVDANK